MIQSLKPPFTICLSDGDMPFTVFAAKCDLVVMKLSVGITARSFLPHDVVFSSQLVGKCVYFHHRDNNLCLIWYFRFSDICFSAASAGDSAHAVNASPRVTTARQYYSGTNGRAILRGFRLLVRKADRDCGLFCAGAWHPAFSVYPVREPGMAASVSAGNMNLGLSPQCRLKGQSVGQLLSSGSSPPFQLRPLSRSAAVICELRYLACNRGLLSLSHLRHRRIHRWDEEWR